MDSPAVSRHDRCNPNDRCSQPQKMSSHRSFEESVSSECCGPHSRLLKIPFSAKSQSWLIAPIREFSEAVARKFRPQKIILFGSYAYGTATEDSDVDLLIVMPRRRYRGEGMSVQIRHGVPRKFPLDLLVRTPAEVARRLRWGDFFMREIMERGEVLYEAHDT